MWVVVMATRLWTNGFGKKPLLKVINGVWPLEKCEGLSELGRGKPRVCRFLSHARDHSRLFSLDVKPQTKVFSAINQLNVDRFGNTTDTFDQHVSDTSMMQQCKANNELPGKTSTYFSCAASTFSTLKSHSINDTSSLFSALESLKRSYSTVSSSGDDTVVGKGNEEKTQNIKEIMENAKAFASNAGEEANSDRDNSSKKTAGDEEGQSNQESAFLRSQRYARWMLLVSFGIGTPVFILQNGSPKYDEFGEVIQDEFSNSPVVIAYIKRAWGEINVVKRDIVEPSSKKLLPDPLQEPYYQPPYTLVIELMDVFLRPVYDSVSGWRFKKRPGIEYFLSQVGPPLFEVVIFTKETGMTAYPLIDSMDQKGYIMYRLFRDAARYKSGFSLGNPAKGELPKLDPYYQKDLRYLNRDLKRVIMVDCDKRAFEKQPLNGLWLEKWDGSSDDTALYDLAGLLRTIATSDIEDVRPVLGHYAQTDDPLEAFKQAQVRMQQDMQLPVHSNMGSQLFASTTNAVSSFLKRR